MRRRAVCDVQLDTSQMSPAGSLECLQLRTLLTSFSFWSKQIVAFPPSPPPPSQLADAQSATQKKCGFRSFSLLGPAAGWKAGEGGRSTVQNLFLQNVFLQNLFLQNLFLQNLFLQRGAFNCTKSLSSKSSHE